MHSFLFYNLQHITVLLSICNSCTSWTTSFISIKLCVGFYIFDSVSFLLKFIFLLNKKLGLFSLKCHNSFQNKGREHSGSKYLLFDFSSPQNPLTFLHLIVAFTTKRIFWCSLSWLYQLAWQKHWDWWFSPCKANIDDVVFMTIYLFFCMPYGNWNLKAVTAESINLNDIRLTSADSAMVKKCFKYGHFFQIPKNKNHQENLGTPPKKF